MRSPKVSDFEGWVGRDVLSRSTLADVENLLMFDMHGGIQAKRAFVDFAGFSSHSFRVAGVVEWQTHRT